MWFVHKGLERHARPADETRPASLCKFPRGRRRLTARLFSFFLFFRLKGFELIIKLRPEIANAENFALNVKKQNKNVHCCVHWWVNRGAVRFRFLSEMERKLFKQLFFFSMSAFILTG